MSEKKLLNNTCPKCREQSLLWHEKTKQSACKDEDCGYSSKEDNKLFYAKYSFWPSERISYE